MEKIKQFVESEKGKDILVVFIVILVGLGSFELGRLSNTGSSSSIKIQYNGETQTANVLSSLKASNLLVTSTNTQSSSLKKFFASSRGKKYYPVGCSAGNTIKQENRIYFNTREQAEKTGYTLSSSCR